MCIQKLKMKILLNVIDVHWFKKKANNNQSRIVGYIINYKVIKWKKILIMILWV